MTNSHHCPICKNGPFKPSCLKKGHMWRCDKHESWIRPGWDCISCGNEARAVRQKQDRERDREAREGGEEQQQQQQRKGGKKEKGGEKESGKGRSEARRGKVVARP